MRTKKIKSNPTVEDTVRLMKMTANSSKNSEAVKTLLSIVPFHNYKNPLEWFRAMAQEIDSRTSYEYDDKDKEQVKTPDRFLLTDKKGDCDDYSVLWSAILKALKKFHYIKIVRYKNSGGWAHVYVVVPVKEGGYITLDNVYIKLRGGMKMFNREVKHYESKIFK